METVRVALAGCGYIGKVHAQVFSQMNNVLLTGVCDINEQAAQEVAGLYGCPAFTTLEGLLSTKPDALDICLPDGRHLQAILAAMDKGLHIFVEKPLTDNMSDAKLVMARAKSYEKKATVGFVCRFDPRFMAAREAIMSGSLGEIQYMTSKRVSPIEGGLRYAPLCRLTSHSGVHDIDLARWFAGGDIRSVYAKGVKGRLTQMGYDVEDAVLSLFTFDNGIIYSQENAWALPAGFPAYIDARFTIAGTKGMLHIDMEHHGLMIYDEKRTEYPDLYHWPLIMGKRGGAMREELESFIGCIINDTQPAVSFTDGFRATQAAFAVLTSLDDSKEVFI